MSHKKCSYTSYIILFFFISQEPSINVTLLVHSIVLFVADKKLKLFIFLKPLQQNNHIFCCCYSLPVGKILLFNSFKLFLAAIKLIIVILLSNSWIAPMLIARSISMVLIIILVNYEDQGCLAWLVSL